MAPPARARRIDFVLLKYPKDMRYSNIDRFAKN